MRTPGKCVYVNSVSGVRIPLSPPLLPTARTGRFFSALIMLRTNRLLSLLQHLRQSRQAITAQELAGVFGVSLRTIYRDIETLRQQGADIRGEAGIGFILHKTDFLLPPLMFNEDEIEALVFGVRSVIVQGDGTLVSAARSLLGKIHDALPPKWSARLATQALYPLSGKENSGYSASELQVLAQIRHALREQHKLHFRYTDASGHSSERTVWPLAIGYFEDSRLLAAWCELRQDFRHFRCDRIQDAKTGEAYPRPQALLLKQWQAQEKVDLLRIYGF